MRNILLSLLLLSSSVTSLAGEADVLSAKIEDMGGGNYRFDVTIQHADEGWEHFAKAWVVLAPDGKILGTRVLRHPHTHKPFTRSSTIAIPEGINEVTIRAYDQVHEFGGKELTIEIHKEKQNDIN
ncbi:MAG: hypothetical protein DHS20C09_17620 [marine bacterium B5-7]|nr:MAG: hypothetical protein DHS20C09_17620 [marine bacterium B5-7]